MADKRKHEEIEPEEELNSNDGDDSLDIEIIDEEAEDELEALEKEVEELQAKANEYLDGWQRARADFTNYKKRVERDQEQVYQAASARIFKRFLEVLDDLDRALKNRPQEGEGAAWAEGIELISHKLQAILESEGAKQMDAQGQYFDPNLHEAITQEESDEYESGQIIEVVKNGYMVGDKVLRPALVRVAK